MAGIEDSNEPVVALGGVDRALAGWGSYLLAERGLLTATVAEYTRFGRSFLESLLVEDRLDLAVLCVGDVNGFLQEKLPSFAISTKKLVLSVMRSLLRFLYVTGQTPARLDVAVVLASAGCRDSGLPRWLPAIDMALMPGVCDRGILSDARSRAIVTIISRLGLRAVEVRRLSLADVDWRSGTMNVAGKGGIEDAMPLPVDEG